MEKFKGCKSLYYCRVGCMWSLIMQTLNQSSSTITLLSCSLLCTWTNSIAVPHPLDPSCWRWSDPADSAESSAPPPAPRCASVARHFSPEWHKGELAGLTPEWRGCTEGEEAPAPQVLHKEGRARRRKHWKIRVNSKNFSKKQKLKTKEITGERCKEKQMHQ